MKLMIKGAASSEEVPDITSLPKHVDVVYAPDAESVAKELPGTEIILSWNFSNDDLQQCWDKATDLKWIHWCGAGVDSALFDELRTSSVMLTNAKGTFDRPMAETVLAYLLMVAKDFKTSMAHKNSKTWEHRMTRMLRGEKVLIIGVGSIGREFARLLNAVGMECYGAGRQAREGDEEFKAIYDSSQLSECVGDFEWVVSVMPSTADTVNFFDASFFSAMNSAAHFLNLGRGNAVVEADLIDALNTGTIAGAMLDVFWNEPLPESDPLWEVENLFISPHISGDFMSFKPTMIKQFTTNVENYLSGQPLHNLVDKTLGFVKSQ